MAPRTLGRMLPRGMVGLEPQTVDLGEDPLQGLLLHALRVLSALDTVCRDTWACPATVAMVTFAA